MQARETLATMKISMGFLKILKLELMFDTVILHTTYTKESKSAYYRDNSVAIFILALVTTYGIRLSTHEWMNAQIKLNL
jgi:hypothetical protein